jgi:DNA-binding transcriptional regulator YdaS (Cro superfamily)
MAKKLPPVEAVIVALGGPSNAARALGISKPNVVTNWKKRGQVPIERVLQIEAATGISRHILRPDIFGAAEQVAV